MTPERKLALNRLRDAVVIPALAGNAAKAIAAAAPPADPRPRFAAGPLRGQLKDKKARMEEQLGLDDPEANQWLGEAAQDPTWKALYDKYETHFGPQVLAEEKARREDASIKSAADSLGTTPDRMLDPANAAEMREREQNAQLRERIADLEGRIRPIPERETAAE